MTGQQPGIDVVAAAGAESDHEVHLFAAIEIGNLIGARGRKRHDERKQECERAKTARNTRT